MVAGFGARRGFEHQPCVRFPLSGQTRTLSWHCQMTELDPERTSGAPRSTLSITERVLAQPMQLYCLRFRLGKNWGQATVACPFFGKERAMAGRRKANFTEKTRRILGGRAGWHCSVPGCSRATVGPGHGDEEVALTGTAAHINSAALSGPRGRRRLTDEQLASAANGIWCCADHGREIVRSSVQE